ncbi:TetR/AcrR family transcriptional regulator [Dolichospermum circinale]|uniref:TetR/AcrR family transcriptional regulator n=1 Tax=Dolichospermum circinale TaxID=109265 RepID=UPI0023310FE0|nr:TetR/AcrR family transcriptional regulator [Dolichospermum circinale]MDB9468825.1 TetR/AcrR family transcriptional regulator [Dolichospermum circinale CS-539/09]MDB9471180.1 TetR/AcrR family transcriptional regulator [Dolichospermum circinale CS-539]
MPKIVNHEQYRKELLGKCFDLFAEKGYAAITMRQISAGLKVSTGALYHYFPNKQALFEQLVEEISQQDIITVLTEFRGKNNLLELMEALGQYLVRNEDYLIKWTYLWVDFCQHQDSKIMLTNSTVFKRANQRCQQLACDLLGVRDVVLASFVLSFVNGVVLEKLWGNENIDFSEQCQLLGEMIVAYLGQKTDFKVSI